MDAQNIDSEATANNEDKNTLASKKRRLANTSDECSKCELLLIEIKRLKALFAALQTKNESEEESTAASGDEMSTESEESEEDTDVNSEASTINELSAARKNSISNIKKSTPFRAKPISVGTPKPPIINVYAKSIKCLSDKIWRKTKNSDFSFKARGDHGSLQVVKMADYTAVIELLKSEKIRFYTFTPAKMFSSSTFHQDIRRLEKKLQHQTEIKRENSFVLTVSKLIRISITTFAFALRSKIQ